MQQTDATGLNRNIRLLFTVVPHFAEWTGLTLFIFHAWSTRWVFVTQRISVWERWGTDWCRLSLGSNSGSLISVWRTVQVQKDQGASGWHTHTHTHKPPLTLLTHKQLYGSDHVVWMAEHVVRLFYSEQALTSQHIASATEHWPLTDCCTNWLLCSWLITGLVITASAPAWTHIPFKKQLCNASRWKVRVKQCAVHLFNYYTLFLFYVLVEVIIITSTNIYWWRPF